MGVIDPRDFFDAPGRVLEALEAHRLAGRRPCDICDRAPATRCEHGNLLLCDACRDTDEPREYCEMVADGGAE